MATLDDKLLGEKLHYYCSSSEDENEPNEAAAGTSSKAAKQSTVQKSSFRRLKQLPSTNVSLYVINFLEMIINLISFESNRLVQKV